MRQIIKTKLGYCGSVLAIFSLLFILSACGNNNKSSTDISDDVVPNSSTDTGSVTFSVVWEGETNTQSRTVRSLSESNCDGGVIVKVAAEIYDPANKLLGSGEEDCSKGKMVLKDIEAGDNRRIVIKGKNAGGNLVYQGEKTGFKVVAGQNEDAGEIIAKLVGLVWNEKSWNEATWN